MISHDTDAAIMDTVGIPDNVTQVMPMPVAAVMQKIIDELTVQ